MFDHGDGSSAGDHEHGGALIRFQRDEMLDERSHVGRM